MLEQTLSFTTPSFEDFDTQYTEEGFYFPLKRQIQLNDSWWIRQSAADPIKSIELFSPYPFEHYMAILQTPHTGKLAMKVADTEGISHLRNVNLEIFFESLKSELKRIADNKIIEAGTFFEL